MLPRRSEFERTLRRVARYLLVVVLTAVHLASVIPAHGQGNPPAEVQQALQDLSNRVGRTLELRNLARWEWTQKAFPDASLGCPQPGQNYAQVVTNGYEIIFEYNGSVYDYRAAIGGEVFLCSGPENGTGTQSATATATPDITPENDDGRTVCEDAMPTRLANGMRGQVRPSGPAVRLRAEAATSAANLQSLASGTAFTVIGGPACNEAFVWWQIEVNSTRGWVAEGSDGVYWLEPLSGQPAPTNTPPPTVAPATTGDQATPTATPGAQLFIDPGGNDTITPANAGQLAPLAELTLGERATGIAWSPDGATLAVSTSSGLWVYNATIFTAPPRLLRVAGGPVLDVAISADNLIATALTDGTVRLWDIATGGQRAVLRGHTQPVRAIAFSPDGTLVASGGGDEATGADSDIRLWDVAARTQTATLAGHEGAITGLAFSPDGTLLASASLDTTVRLWDVASASPVTILTNHTAAVRDVAFDPAGSLLASAADDAQIVVLTLGSGDQITLTNDDTTIDSVRFSPDGTLLVSSGTTGDDPVLQLWDIASGEVVATKAEFNAATTEIAGLAFSPDGDSLAFVTLEVGTTVRIWGVASA